MTAYWVAHAHINDAVEYKKYTDRLGPLFVKANVKIHARGGAYKVLEGELPFERHIVVEFPSMAEAEAFFNSPEYQEAASYRRAPGVANNQLVIVEAGDVTK